MYTGDAAKVSRAPVDFNQKGEYQSLNNENKANKANKAGKSIFATVGASFLRRLTPQQKKKFDEISRPTQQSTEEGKKYGSVSERLLKRMGISQPKIHVDYNSSKEFQTKAPQDKAEVNKVETKKTAAPLTKAEIVKEGWGKLTPAQRRERFGFLANGLVKNMGNEGIFRKAASEADSLEEFPKFFSNDNWQSIDNSDVHLKAGLFKNCLKEASIFDTKKEEILGFEKKNDADKEQAARDICDSLQPEQRQLLTMLMRTMDAALSKVDTNKMDAKNLAIVISPNLFKEAENPMVMMEEIEPSRTFFRYLLENRDTLKLVPPWEKGSLPTNDQQNTLGSHRLPNQ